MVHLELIAHVLELRDRFVGQDGKLLVGGGGHRQGEAQGGHPVPEAEGQGVGVAGGVQIGAVFQQGLELEAQEAALGEHGAPALDVPAEVRPGPGEDQGLAEEGAVLGAADVEDIRQSRVVREGHVPAGQGGTQPGPVQEEDEPVLVAALPEGRQLRLGVDGAGFRGVGDVDHGGLHLVLVAVELGDGLDHGGSNFPVGAGDGDDLVPRALDGPGFVDVDVSRVGGDDGLVGLQHGLNHQQVRLGAPHHEVYVRLGGGAEGTDEGPRLFTAGVQAVAPGLLQIGLGEGFQHHGMGPFAVVVSETVHI